MYKKLYMIKRDLQELISKNLFKGKLILLTGPRQVGKTTLMQQISADLNLPSLWLNCDEPEARALLTDINLPKLHTLLGNNKLILIDEGQRVKNIGLSLKIEIKFGKDRMSQAQGRYKQEIEKTGGRYMIAKDFDSFLIEFRELYKSYL